MFHIKGKSSAVVFNFSKSVKIAIFVTQFLKYLFDFIENMNLAVIKQKSSKYFK